MTITTISEAAISQFAATQARNLLKATRFDRLRIILLTAAIDSGRTDWLNSLTDMVIDQSAIPKGISQNTVV